MKRHIAYMVSAVLLGTSAHVLAADCERPSLHNTSWSVAVMNNDLVLKNPHPTPWVFQETDDNGGTASAEGHWKASWRWISCKGIYMERTDGKKDTGEFFFVNSKRFIGVKGDNIHRFGKKIQ